jgi:hypothetical protein
MRTIISTMLFVILLLATRVFAIQPAEPDQERISAALETLQQGVNSHQFSRLEPMLAPGFSYQGRGGETGRMIMRQVVSGFPDEIRAITVLETQLDRDRIVVTVNLELEGSNHKRTLVFDQQYRFLEATISEIQLAGHDSPSSQPPVNSGIWPDQTIIPFELADRLIVVQAEVNGVAGNYLLDSGAPTIMLNRSYFSTDEIKTHPLNSAMPTGAGGLMSDVEGTDNLTLNWGGLEINGQSGLVADLSHLEESVGVSITGLIGYAALEPFQVQFDYQRKVVTLLRLDDNNQPVSPAFNGAPEAVFELEMMGHIPVIAVSIGGQDLKMGIDSGAEEAMLFTQWQEPLREHYEFIRRDELKGGDTNIQMGDVVQVDRLQLDSLYYDNMIFHINDIGGETGHVAPFDGLLGYEFIAARPTAINFRTKQLLVWPEGA